jgi:DNA invertase Pin-like site-specific DNA recombinase
VVTVTKLDRLGRSTRELLDLIERIGKAGAAFRSLGDSALGHFKLAGPAIVDTACCYRGI